MKKFLATVLALCLVLAALSACQGSNDPADGNSGGVPAQNDTSANPGQSSGGDNGAIAGEDAGDAVATGDMTYSAEGIIDGRFVETKKISVLLFDRNLDEGTRPENNVWSNWIKDNVLKDLNIEIEWVITPRWGEEEQITNLLATGEAPDVSLTYNFAAITQYWNMNGVLDIAPIFDGYKDLLPNVWERLGPVNMHAARDPETGSYAWIETSIANNSRINTFVREDWLNTLSLPEPKTRQQFEDMLVAFKDNAAVLLPDRPGSLVPFSLMQDVGWRANNLIISFVPNDMTDKDAFIYGYDDRQFLYPNYKEGVRELNKWYNMGLIWSDFFLYSSGDNAEDDNIKAGNVGSFMHNWDYPYRSGDKSIQVSMKANVGEEAAFIAVDPFQNDAGLYRKFAGSAFDRKIFFPNTNKEPLASAMYVDWISRSEVITYLQIGDENVSHIVRDDGAIELIDNTGNEYMQNSLNNIDYTITINGLHYGDPVLTGNSLSFSYTPVEPYYIGKAYSAAQNDARVIPHFNVGELTVVSPTALADKRNETLNKAVAAKVEDFDAVYDAGMNDYLASNGQMVIDERRAAFEKYIE